MLRGDVEGPGVVARDEDRESPLEALAHVLRGPAVPIDLGHRDVPLLAPAPIVARELAEITAAIGDVRITRVEGDRRVLASRDGEVVAEADAPLLPARGDGDRGVVLLGRIDAVGELVVGVHMVELRRRLRVLARPGRPAVEGDRRAAVVPEDHARGVRRVDPEEVLVAVRGIELLEGLPAVDRLEDAQVHHVDGVLVRRVRGHRGVVPAPHPHPRVVVHPRPGGTGVIGPEEAARGVGGLDVGVDPVRVRARDVEPDLAEGAPWDAGRPGQLRPRVATIRGLPDPALPAPREHRPGCALELVGRGIEDARVRRVHREVVRARRVVDEEHLLPALPAVRGPEDPALGVRPEGVADRRDVDAVRVARVHDDIGDLVRLLEPEGLPAAPGVGGAVHPRTEGEVLAELGFAAAHVDHVGIARGDGDGAHGGEVALPVGEVLPGEAAVRRAPDAAVHRPHVEQERLVQIPDHGVHAPAAVGTDVPPSQRLQGAVGGARRGVQRGVVRRQRRRGCGDRPGALRAEEGGEGDGEADEGDAMRQGAEGRHADNLWA